MKTLVISAFPATGKTYTTKKLKAAGWKVLDMDSSEFHWKNFGNGKLEENPDFIKDYMHSIMGMNGEVDIIFVSTHEELRKALRENNIDYKVVYPSIELREAWIGRCFLRGDSREFCEKLAENWDEWINNITRTEKYRNSQYVLGDCYNTLEDVLNSIFYAMFLDKSRHMDWISIGTYFKTRE